MKPIWPPTAPPSNFTEEYKAMHYALSLASSDSKAHDKAFLVMQYVLLYSHGLVPQIEPAELQEFTYEKFITKQLVGMEGVEL